MIILCFRLERRHATGSQQGSDAITAQNVTYLIMRRNWRNSSSFFFFFLIFIFKCYDFLSMWQSHQPKEKKKTISRNVTVSLFFFFFRSMCIIETRWLDILSWYFTEVKIGKRIGIKIPFRNYLAQSLPAFWIK